MTTQIHIPKEHPLLRCTGGKDDVAPRKISRNLIEVGDGHFAAVRLKGLPEGVFVRDHPLPDKHGQPRASVKYLGHIYDVTHEQERWEIPETDGVCVEYFPPKQVSIVNRAFLEDR